MTDQSTPSPSDSTIDKLTLGLIVAGMGKRQELDSEKSEVTDGQTRPRVRLTMRVDPLWLGRVQVQADRLGLPLSTYMHQALTQRLEADEATDPSIQKKRSVRKKGKGPS